MKKFLHVGCGSKTKSKLKGFNSEDWQEIRFDIDPKVNPDIQGTLTDMVQVESNSMDAIFSSHNIEHVYPYEVPIVLAEFHRVLKPDGIVVITCPDLQSVCQAIVEDKLTDPLYGSPAGQITPLDILYGYVPAMEKGNLFMAHRTGFTYSSLSSYFSKAGFKSIAGGRKPSAFELWLVAFKAPTDSEKSISIAQKFLPLK